MRRIRPVFFAVALALPLLAGCAAPPSSSSATQVSTLPPEVMPTDPAPESRPTPPPASHALCDAGKGQWAIGQPATPEVIERVRVATGSRIARVNRPGDPGYEHYSPERVEIAVDGRNTILGVTCG